MQSMAKHTHTQDRTQDSLCYKCTSSSSPWYNSNGWLGVKHQVTSSSHHHHHHYCRRHHNSHHHWPRPLGKNEVTVHIPWHILDDDKSEKKEEDEERPQTEEKRPSWSLINGRWAVSRFAGKEDGVQRRGPFRRTIGRMSTLMAVCWRVTAIHHDSYCGG